MGSAEDSWLKTSCIVAFLVLVCKSIGFIEQKQGRSWKAAEKSLQVGKKQQQQSWQNRVQWGHQRRDWHHQESMFVLNWAWTTISAYELFRGQRSCHAKYGIELTVWLGPIRNIHSCQQQSDLIAADLLLNAGCLFCTKMYEEEKPLKWEALTHYFPLQAGGLSLPPLAGALRLKFSLAPVSKGEASALSFISPSWILFVCFFVNVFSAAAPLPAAVPLAFFLARLSRSECKGGMLSSSTCGQVDNISKVVVH